MSVQKKVINEIECSNWPELSDTVAGSRRKASFYLLDFLICVSAPCHPKLTSLSLNSNISSSCFDF